MVRVTHFTQFEIDFFFCSQSLLHLRCLFAATQVFQRFINFQRGYSNADAGAGYTFYPHSLILCICKLLRH